MSIFGICVLVIIFILILGVMTCDSALLDFSGIVLGSMVSLLTTFTIWGVIWIISVPFAHRYLADKYNVTLAGLSNSSGVQGHLTLGSGTIEGVQYIFYNVKTRGNVIKTYKVVADDAIIKQDDSTPKSYLEVNIYKSKPSCVFTWIIPEGALPSGVKYVFHLRKEDINVRNYYDISNY